MPLPLSPMHKKLRRFGQIDNSSPSTTVTSKAVAFVFGELTAWCIMADTSYRIVHREDDTFAVEILRVGALPQMAAGFATEAAARSWIAQDKRLHATSDTFGTPAGRRLRGN